MDFNTAVKVLQGQRKPGAEGYVEYQQAAAIYRIATDRDFHADKMDGQVQRRLTTDQAPRFGTSGASNLNEADPRNARSGVHGGLEADVDGIGGEIVARLPRSASSYQLLDTDQGCVVLLIGNPDNVIDPGAISSGTEPRMRGSLPSSVGDARYQQNRHHALSMLARAAGAKVA